MKQFKLQQWYPTLPTSWECEHEYRLVGVMNGKYQIKNMDNSTYHILDKKELHSNFWRLIEDKNPLFITEDGVYVPDPGAYIIIVTRDFKKRLQKLSEPIYDDDKVFAFLANADEYIWCNKKAFSYSEIEDYLQIEAVEKFEQLAKERAKQ